jgi:DNA repair protein RadA/Sms
MARSRTRSVFVCQACGYQAGKWLGRCPQCQEWNSLVEEVHGGERASPAASRAPSAPASLSEIELLPELVRIASGLDEVDRVLGGGIVPGSVVLLGGEPGIGKSTLLCQLLDGIARRLEPHEVLCVSGEESVSQTGMRARRLGAGADNLKFLAETNLERILNQIDRDGGPRIVAIDSIQTVYTSDADSIPGSVGQVRECASRLMQVAKQRGVATILVGHVTKEGTLAGPKVLEHLVDVVLQFDGEGGSSYRILRGQKNRFGSTRELGVFEMAEGGLREVVNPSELFLAERPRGAPGSVVVASAEGSRPILVEIQALVAPPSAGVGRRTAAGVDGKRVALLLAVLAQRASCDVLAQDVFINVAGGARLGEPAIDLGIACAVASSARGRAVDPETAVFGEIGLAGEVRGVSMAPVRIAEVEKLGFRRCLVPRQNAEQLEGVSGLAIEPIGHLREALDRLS